MGYRITVEVVEVVAVVGEAVTVMAAGSMTEANHIIIRMIMPKRARKKRQCKSRCNSVAYNSRISSGHACCYISEWC